MSTTQQKADYITKQIVSAGDIRLKKMFGEYCVYCNDKVVAIICDNTLFVKITEISDNFLKKTHHAPAYPGSKDYLKVPEEKLRDIEWLCGLISETEIYVNKKKIK